MNVNYLAVVLATIAQFVAGAIWYMPLFGELWGKIHGFDKLPKEKQAEMSKAMAPWYGVQLVVTVASAYALALLIGLISGESPYFIAFLVWAGFVLPTTASNMIFGGSPEGYVWHKISITSAEALVHLLAAAWVITMF
jgi:hypothetical protein